MRIYLVDFENVKSKGLVGIDELTENDYVIIFYSENSDTISFEMHQRVLTSKAEIEYFKVNVGGKNALDFQLSTLLGYLVAKDMYTHIFVISNDRGFDFLHDFWHGKYVESPSSIVYRTKTILAGINYSNTIIGDEQQNDIDEVADETSNNDDELSDDNYENYDTDNSENAEVTEEEADESDDMSNDISVVQVAPAYHTILSNDLADCNDDDIAKIEDMIISSGSKEEFHNSLAKVYKSDAAKYYKLLKSDYLKIKNSLSKNDTVEEEPEQAVAQSTDSITERLEQLLPNNSPETIKAVKKCVFDAETRQQFYIKMVQAFRRKRGCELYNAVKSEYNALHSTAAESCEEA